MCLTIVALALVSAYLVVAPPRFAVELFEFDPVPYAEDRYFLLVLGLLSGLASYLYETYVIEHMLIGARER